MQNYGYLEGLVLLSALGCALPLSAEIAVPQDAMLTVTPQVCITNAQDNACNIKIALNWRVPGNTAICIESSHPDIPRWCSDNHDIDSLEFNISVTSDIQFVMLEQESNQTLADAQLRVTQVSEPQMRRRYRNPWSLF